MNFLIKSKKKNIRKINGILLIDKPSGISSNATLQKIKKIFHAEKAGHAGTLDVLATGMLPIFFGKFTKLSQYVLNSDKTYKVVAKLGKRTNTMDSEGKIINIRPVKINFLILKEKIKYFYGKIYQIPPMFSAIKYNGKELYKYARKGIILPRKKRKIYIYDIKILFWNKKIIELYIHCSKGTYIRTIIDDLGELIGCGAHVIKLKRLSVGNFLKEKMISIKKLKFIYKNKKNLQNFFKKIDKFLLPINNKLLNIDSINISYEEFKKIFNGKEIYIKSFIKNTFVYITQGKKKIFLGIGKIKNKKLKLYFLYKNFF
ncbi:tRNA pseudouridine(55) synthase TruB [Sodalis-like secondary symbiont of Drepanosiphum platanoidis]|uniref:tRNA pseudouridine(55) synthase TruB n=1 Tax=Sodalis-like secondary symbiont of Drepanosiphum platanoidis TaxID=2994493 RepID=UPI003463B1FA